jgi:hypothetical protein
MSEEGIARWKRPIGAAAGFDEFDSMVEEVLAMSVDGSEMVPMGPAGTLGTAGAEAEQRGAIAPVSASQPDFVAVEPAASRSLPEDDDASEPSPEPAGAVSAGNKASDADAKPTSSVPRWLFSLVGHVLAAVLGLAIGYLVLSWLRPETFPLPW